MFKTRLLSGILLVVIALATIIPGNDILLALLLLVSLIGMSELYKVRNLHVSLPGIVGYAAAAACYVLIRLQVKGSGESEVLAFFDRQGLGLLVIAILIILMAVYVFSYPKYVAEEMMLVFFWDFLCGADVVLCLSDTNDSGRRCLSGVAGISFFLGMRHLCLLCGYVDWKA